MQRIIRSLIAGDAQLHAITRRIKRDLVTLDAAAFDVGFGRVLDIVVVDDHNLVFLGKPPGHQIVKQGFDRIDRDQHAFEFAAIKNRHHHLNKSPVAFQKERFAINPFAKAAGHVECLVGHGRAKSGNRLVGQRRGRQGIHHLALRIKPEQLRKFGIVFQQMGGAQAKDFFLLRQTDHVGGQLLQLFFVAAQMKAEVLLQPQHILDQGRPILLRLIVLQQPEQRKERRQQQDDAEFGQCQQPGHAAGVAGDDWAKSIHGRNGTPRFSRVRYCGFPLVGYPQ